MSPTYLDWKINPKIERYRLLGLGERDPDYEGSFIIPVSAYWNDGERFVTRRRRMHVIARKYFGNQTDGRGIGNPNVVAAVTAIGKDGELLPPIQEEMVLLFRRVAAAKVEKSNYYEIGFRRKYFMAGDMMSATYLSSRVAPKFLNTPGNRRRDDYSERAMRALERIFGAAVPDFAGYMFYCADAFLRIYSADGNLAHKHRQRVV